MLIASVTAADDHAAYLRGKLRLAGLDGDTPLSELLDAVTALMVDGVPDMRRWRDKVDIASWKVCPPSRDEWGKRPDQASQQQALMGQQR